MTAPKDSNLYLKLANGLDLRITVPMYGWTSKMTRGLGLASVFMGLGGVLNPIVSLRPILSLLGEFSPIN